MTRITNFGRKRTYLEAGFGSGEQDAPESEATGPIEESQEGNGSAPQKKKRKRTKPSMRDGNTGVKAEQAAAERAEKAALKAKALENGDLSGLSKSAKKKLRLERAKSTPKEAPVHFDPSERRRMKRQNDRLETTTCFICREKGHPARDCPNSENRKGTNTLVGICYRCGSDNHTLSRCRKPADPEDPLPFASCFVCNTNGHLASACPQNKDKGVYPNGGCCKLCGETTHLAKDCTLRKRGEPVNASLIGTGQAAGADEDDFHLIKRQNDQMDRVEKKFDKTRRMEHNPGARPTPSVQSRAKKVVNFK